MATWEEIRDEVAGMLADGKPLEDVIGKLEQRKNEMAKANLLKAMNDMKKREQTNEEWFCTLSTEEKAEWMAHQSLIALLENQNNHSLRMTYPAYWVEWLKQPHTPKE